MIKSIWKKWPFLFKFRLFLGLILFILILTFLYLKIVPFGSITYSRDFTSSLRSGKGFIYGLTPAERVVIKKGEAPQVIGDPVYFSLFTPRTFDSAKLTIVYRDNLGIDTPVIEAGVLVDNIVWRYDLQPIDNKALDYLSLRWNKIEENGNIFLQKNNNYKSLSAFVRDFKAGQLKSCANELDNCLAVYNYSPEYNYRISNNQPSLPLVVNTPLRGAHQFYVYLGDKETLRLDFTFVDINQDAKAVPINIILSSKGKIIMAKLVPDDNKNLGTGITSEKEVVLDPGKLPEGVYKVEVKISDDMVIKKIDSSVNRLSFINKVWPVSNPGTVTFYTDANFLQVKALNPASLQTLNFGGQDFTIPSAYQQFDFVTSAAGKIKTVNLKKDDLILENNGVFALSPNSLFNPALQKVDQFFSVKMPFEYIVANYKAPVEEEGYKTATANFNLKGAYRENGKYSFMISVPGLRAEDGINDNLEIYQIKIELKGRTLWQKIWGL